MKSKTALFSWASSLATLIAAMALLTTDRLEYCGRPLTPARAFSADEGCLPTPAPPQKVVVLHVAADRLDLEVGWADN